MALNKLIDYGNGSSTSVHIVSDITLPETGTARIGVRSYVNADWAALGIEKTFAKLNYELSEEQNQTLKDQINSMVQDFLKTLPDFNGAIDS